MKCDLFLAICVHCHQVGKPIICRDCHCTGVCAGKGEIIIVVNFLGLFGLVLGFKPFGGLTFFVSPWFPEILDPVALFATIPAVAPGGTGMSIIRVLLLFSAVPPEPACQDLNSSIIHTIRASDVSIGKLALTTIMNIDHNFGNDVNSVFEKS